MKARMTVWALSLLAGALVAGCGGDDDGPGDTASGGTTTGDVAGDAAELDFVESGTVAMVDLLAEALFDAPWPIDTRRTADGLDLTGFPNPDNIELVNRYLAATSTSVTGYSPTPAIFFRFKAALDPTTFTSVEASAQPGSNVIIVNIDESSSHYLTRHPLNTAFQADDSAKFIPVNTLSLQPIFGFPLKHGTTYAAIVTTGVKDAAGQPIGQAKAVHDGLSGTGPLAELYAPLREWVGRPQNTDVSLDDIAVATVFTVGEPNAELLAIADFVRVERPAPTILDVVPTSLSAGESGGHTTDYDMYEGHYVTPNFQSGEVPYKEKGGGIKLDDAGKPIVQVEETVRFALTVPKGPMPDAGWPICVYGHGTGGDWKSFAVGGGNKPAAELARAGIAVISTDQPLHGTRFDGDTSNYLNSFNFLNPEAARSNFRQSGIDVMVMVRVAREALKVPPAAALGGEEILFDASNVFYFGHSHGALSGALVAAYMPGVKATVLSAAGGGLSHTLMERKDLFDIEALLQGALLIDSKDELSIAHPVLTIIQTLVDITDPLSYAPLFNAPPGSARKPLNILLTEGTKDAATPPISTDNLAAAAEIPIITPQVNASAGHDVLGLVPEVRPVHKDYVNKWGFATAGLAQFKNADHFAVFQVDDATKMVVGFFETALSDKDGVPTIK